MSFGETLPLWSETPESSREDFGEGLILLRQGVGGHIIEIVSALDEVLKASPFRRMMTPMGKQMSVEMTSCGEVGWVADHTGYRYQSIDPLTGRAWPPMPMALRNVAIDLAERAGYPQFSPDVCLINRYAVGTAMGLHQDKDERCFDNPIVSVSLGLPIQFKIGGTTRTSTLRKIELCHGDALIFGGASRLAFHGVGRLRRGSQPVMGAFRLNLTFRRAL